MGAGMPLANTARRHLRNDVLAAYTACDHAHQLEGRLSYHVHHQTQMKLQL